MRRYRNLSSKLDSLEHLLGEDAANFLGAHRLEKWYSQKWDVEVEAMIRSGNLVRLQFPVTNLVIRREEVAGEWFRLPEHSEGDVEIMGVDAVSNLVTIICRPKYAPIFGTLFQWRSPDSSLRQRAEAAAQLAPRGATRRGAERILGLPTRCARFRAPFAADPAYAPLANDFGLPEGTSEGEAQNLWCDFYDFPGGEYVCFCFDAKNSKWSVDLPLVRVWFGHTNDAQTIRFPKNEH